MKKYELTSIQGKNIVLDISQLLKKEMLYINVTSLARQFGKNRQRVLEFFNSKTYLEYEDALFKVTKSRDFKTEEKGFRYSVKGKYGGMYLHSDLLIIFLRWLDPKFSVMCDIYIKNKIQKIHDEKSKAVGRIEANRENEEWLRVRVHGKYTRKQFTDTIKKFCKYAEQQRGSQYTPCPYYKNITDAIYSYIGVPILKTSQSPRDVYSGHIVEGIQTAELIVIELLNEVMQSNGSRKGIKPLIIDRLTHEMGNFI